jgi:hypothetical protein
MLLAGKGCVVFYFTHWIVMVPHHLRWPTAVGPQIEYAGLILNAAAQCKEHFYFVLS